MLYTKTLEDGLKEFDEKFPLDNFVYEGGSTAEFSYQENNIKKLKSFLTTFAEKIRGSVVGEVEKLRETRHGADCLTEMGIDNCTCPSYHINKTINNLLAQLKKI